MGVNFALNLGPSLKYCPVGLSEATWVKHKRVVRTLVSLRKYVQLPVFRCIALSDIRKLVYLNAGLCALC